MKLAQLINHIFSKKVIGDIDIEISDIQSDSRKIKPGDLFIAHKGYTVDGHDFIDKAIEQGATAIVMEKERMLPQNITSIIVNDSLRAMSTISCTFFDHPSEKMTMIGVTGTNGKTTTTNLIEKVYSDQGFKTGIIGTIYNKIDDIYEDSVNTTPSSLDLQRLLNRMVQKGVTHVVMEVSSHALVEGRVRGVFYDHSIFTNLTQDHLDFHGTMEAYKNAKGLLFSQLGNSVSDNKFSILNNDDDTSEYYKTISTAEVITYGIEKSSDFTVFDYKITSKGTLIKLNTPFGRFELNSKLIGKFNIYNMLCAIVSCSLNGIKMEDIIASLETIKGVDGRFEVVETANKDITVIVDYAHTPDSLENVLTTINEFKQNRIICIVGCGGNRDKTKRPIMASIAERYSDIPILTSDNPRFEDPEDILLDMEKGMVKNDYIKIIDRKEAIEHAVSIAEKGDIILIAGKGHENYQIIGNEKSHFSDKEIAQSVILN